MIDSHRETDDRALRRLLANGPLDAVPKRPADQDLLVRLAAVTIALDREYSEAELDEQLKEWLATFAEPCGIDHVTLRRMLVDSRLITRTLSGSAYVRNALRSDEIEALRHLRPADVLEAVRREREARKRSAQDGLRDRD
jgi:hypothetical protein